MSTPSPLPVTSRPVRDRLDVIKATVSARLQRRLALRSELADERPDDGALRA